MPHPIVEQLRFTRSEWLRGLARLSEHDGARHCGRMNSIGWIVGHLTWQEQRYLLHRPQDIMLFPAIQERFAFGAPMSTPSLAEMRKAWRTVTAAADPFLDSLTTADLLKDLPINGKRSGQTQGSAILRLTHHYWFHIGEIQAIRQILDHTGLPQYVGNIEAKAPYRPEARRRAASRTRKRRSRSPSR
ncbi:MAG TPA: DinB family protein [Candidatus Limnocylindria bacterium]|nr:DinB family protein [Candidatus Limnocylindria bacterium]